MYLYLFKFFIKVVCGVRIRLKLGVYDLREGFLNNGFYIEGMYVVINVMVILVRFVKINWVIGGIFCDF